MVPPIPVDSQLEQTLTLFYSQQIDGYQAILRRIEQLPQKFEADPGKAEGMEGKYLFVIDGEGTWAVTITEGGMEVTEGACDDAGCTIKVAGEDWNAIIAGELETTTAFMTGKLQIEGDMSMAMKLPPLLGDL